MAGSAVTGMTRPTWNQAESKRVFPSFWAVKSSMLPKPESASKRQTARPMWHDLRPAVLRSLSHHPFVAEHRELIHKIGVTGGKVETRPANAAHDATYLLADVELVARYKLADINRAKLKNLFHRIFAPAQLDLTIQDRFGHPVHLRERFFVPLHVIDEAVTRIRDGSITRVLYDPKTAGLLEE